MEKTLPIFSFAGIMKLLSEVELRNKKDIPALDDALEAIKKHSKDTVDCGKRGTWGYVHEYIPDPELVSNSPAFIGMINMCNCMVFCKI